MCDHLKISDTAVEPVEVVLPNGETVIELETLELETCPTCETTIMVVQR